MNVSGKATESGNRAARTLGPVSDLERHLPADWWRTLFNAMYLKTDGDVVENGDNTREEVDRVLNATGLSPSDRVLDLCCGQGRHALELAARGFGDVLGIDRSRYLVRLARRRARQAGYQGLHFSEGDARNFKHPESTRDGVLILGNSFGYFEHAEDDLAVLRRARRALVPGGTLVLDIVDGTWMAANFEPRSWEWIDERHFVNRERSLSADGPRIISREVVTDAESGVIADQFYAERLYTFDDIATRLRDVGFGNVVLHDDIEGRSSRGGDLGMMAHRMLITAIADKPQPKRRLDRIRPLELAVVLGDPRLPDIVKRDGQFGAEDLDTVARMRTAVETLDGFEARFLDDHATLFETLARTKPDLVFNLCDEGYTNQALMELHVPAMLEILGIPYTGAGPTCLGLCYHKEKTNAIAASMEIPVPLETCFLPDEHAANIPSSFPALVKPAWGDSSLGIDEDAVVHDASALLAYRERLRALVPGVPLLIQEFLPGREFSVGLIGNTGQLDALPVLEVDYSHLPDSLPRILSYASKWDPQSPYWLQLSYREANIDEELRARLVAYSRILFERLECRDYARFDFRCNAFGEPKLLEVNPNPGWCWDGKLNLMAGFAGLDYAVMLRRIIEAGARRYGLEASLLARA